MQINHEAMKQSNRSKILNVIYQKKMVTRQEIAKILKISLPTVFSNVNDMIEEGILEDAGVAKSTGGRKPAIIKLIPSGRYSIGVEIKQKEAQIILTDLNSNIIGKDELKWTKFDLDKIMAELSKKIVSILKINEVAYEKLLGIGFALPGIVDEETLILENAPNIGISNIDFSKYKNLFPVPIYIENEANAGSYAEGILTKEGENSNLIFISIAHGIGTGILIHNKLYKGNNKKAGEFGHMKISPSKEKCNCGRYGCWEMFSSETALIKQYEKIKGETANIDEIFRQYLNKQEAARLVLDKYIDYLLIGIENIILGLSPDIIVIGGRISEYEEIILPIIKERLGKEKTIYEIGKTKITCSKLGKIATLHGAALLPFHKLFNYEKVVI